MPSPVKTNTAKTNTVKTNTVKTNTVKTNTVKTGGGVRANEAWEALLAAHAALMKRFAAEGLWADVSMREYDVLYTLSKCPEPVRLSELNRHVLLSQPALSRLVDRLAGRGLVEREADPADGRGIRLSLTSAGRVVQRQVGRRHARGVARVMTAGLNRGELRALEMACLKLARQAAASHAPAANEAIVL